MREQLLTLGIGIGTLGLVLWEQTAQKYKPSYILRMLGQKIQGEIPKINEKSKAIITTNLKLYHIAGLVLLYHIGRTLKIDRYSIVEWIQVSYNNYHVSLYGIRLFTFSL